jgi:hypothetical protein
MVVGISTVVAAIAVPMMKNTIGDFKLSGDARTHECGVAGEASSRVGLQPIALVRRSRRAVVSRRGLVERPLCRRTG